MRLLLVFAFLTVSLLAGCARPPASPTLPPRVTGQQAYTPPFSSPENQSRTSTEQQHTVLTLQQCIAIGIKNNPELRAVESDVAAAEAKLSGSTAAMFPKVSAVGGYTYYKEDVRLLQGTYNGEPALYTDQVASGDLVLSMPLFAGGKLYNQMLASELLQFSAKNKQTFSQEELEFNITSLYLNIIAQKRVIESLDRSHASLTEQTKQIQAKIDVQKAAKVELLRAEVRLADVQQRRIAENNAYVTARLTLINLMGVTIPEEMLVLAEKLQAPEKVADIKIPSITEVLLKRQDYQAAMKALEAQGKMVSSAQGAHWPQVSLKGSYSHKRAVGSYEATKAPSEGEIGNIGVMVEIPLFDGGAISARVREEKAKQSAAQQRLIKLEKQIGLEVQSAVLSIQSSLSRIEAARTGQEQAAESYRIESMKYELGKGTILDTLDAESSLLQADVTYYRALADYYTAKAKFRLATGEKL